MSRAMVTKTSGNVAARLHRRGVRIPELVIGIFIICSCVLGAVLWQSSGATGTAVLVASRALTRGHVIIDTDLDTVTLTSSDEIALLAASNATAVIGMRVITNISSASPITASQLTSVATLGNDEGLVGLVISLSQAPSNLSAGDIIQVVGLTANSDGTKVITKIPGLIQIWEISEPDVLNGQRAVTLRVPLSSAGDLVGNGELHLVKVVG